MSPASRPPDAAGNAPAVWLASQTKRSACVTSSRARNATKPRPTRQYRLRYQTGLPLTIGRLISGAPHRQDDGGAWRFVLDLASKALDEGVDAANRHKGFVGPCA